MQTEIAIAQSSWSNSCLNLRGWAAPLLFVELGSADDAPTITTFDSLFTLYRPTRTSFWPDTNAQRV
jgi:hypothetical protein